MDTIKVYLNSTYTASEVKGQYPYLSNKQLGELMDAMYEVELIYNFNTHKFEIPE